MAATKVEIQKNRWRYFEDVASGTDPIEVVPTTDLPTALYKTKIVGGTIQAIGSGGKVNLASATTNLGSIREVPTNALDGNWDLFSEASLANLQTAVNEALNIERAAACAVHYDLIIEFSL